MDPLRIRENVEDILRHREFPGLINKTRSFVVRPEKRGDANVRETSGKDVPSYRQSTDGDHIRSPIRFDRDTSPQAHHSEVRRAPTQIANQNSLLVSQRKGIFKGKCCGNRLKLKHD